MRHANCISRIACGSAQLFPTICDFITRLNAVIVLKLVATASNHRAKSTNRPQKLYLPVFFQEKRVLWELSGARFLVDNSQLNSERKQLGYRLSKKMDDLADIGYSVAFGCEVEGTLSEGWLEVVS